MKLRFPIFEKNPNSPLEVIIGALLIIFGLVSVVAFFVTSLIVLGPWMVPIYGTIVLIIAFWKGMIVIEK